MGVCYPLFMIGKRKTLWVLMPDSWGLFLLDFLSATCITVSLAWVKLLCSNISLQCWLLYSTLSLNVLLWRSYLSAGRILECVGCCSWSLLWLHSAVYNNLLIISYRENISNQPVLHLDIDQLNHLHWLVLMVSQLHGVLCSQSCYTELCGTMTKNSYGANSSAEDINAWSLFPCKNKGEGREKSHR